MKILVATSSVPFIRGGAEILADNLRDALAAAGHEAELVSIPFKHYPPERIPDHMLACRLLDLTETCGVRIDQSDRAEISRLSDSPSEQSHLVAASASHGL